MHQRVSIECVSFNYGRPPGPTPVIDKSGIFSTAHGLRIACLGGAYAPEKYYGKMNGAVSNHPSSYITFSFTSLLGPLQSIFHRFYDETIAFSTIIKSCCF